MSAKCEVPCFSGNSKFGEILSEATSSKICAHFLTKSVKIWFQSTIAHDVKCMAKLQTTINFVAKKLFSNFKLAIIYAEITSP